MVTFKWFVFFINHSHYSSYHNFLLQGEIQYWLPDSMIPLFFLKLSPCPNGFHNSDFIFTQFTIPVSSLAVTCEGLCITCPVSSFLFQLFHMLQNGRESAQLHRASVLVSVFFQDSTIFHFFFCVFSKNYTMKELKYVCW